MKKESILISIILLLIISCGNQEQVKFKTLDEWENYSGLGKYQQKTDNWEEIKKIADNEKSLNIFTDTNEILPLIRVFSEETGYKVTNQIIKTYNLAKKIQAEQDSGIFSVDTIVTGNIPDLSYDFVNSNYLYKYIPSEFYKLMDEGIKKYPAAVYRTSLMLPVFNSTVFQNQPVNNWWDLTESKWNTRVIMKDPINNVKGMVFISSFIKNAEKIEKEYIRKYNIELELSETENAGYEFIKRLMNNGLILCKTNREVISTVSSKKSFDNAFIGIAGISSVKDENIEGIHDLEPFSYFASQKIVSIAKYSKNPNVSKIFIKYLFNKERSKNYLFSIFADTKRNNAFIDFTKIYYEDSEWFYNNHVDIADFFVQNI